MEITEVIRRGIMTEKAVRVQTPAKSQVRKKPDIDDQTHKYVFEVALTATKVQIRQAVEAMFPDVTVLAVNTLRMPGKSRTVRTVKGVRYSTPRPWKKAYVTVRAKEIITPLLP
jgi:large subunit ribosomal protein L23